MKKFKVNDWVEFQDSPETKILGVVTQVPADGRRTVHVRWIRSNFQAGEVAASKLTKSIPMPFVLEGNLADDLHEPRSERGLLTTWFDSIKLKFAFKSIHQMSDIDLLAKRVNTKILPPFIHISSHGYVDAEKRPCIQLLDDELHLDDPKTIEVFSQFEGYPVFFSACLLGRFQEPIKKFQAAAKLGPIVVSTREIYDYEAMLFGLMLYQCIIRGCLTFEDAVIRCIEALRIIGIKGCKGRGQAYARLI
jgi:hypothetical protein